MRVISYAYPWDVLEPSFLRRLKDLESDEIAVASSYHSTRAATPWAEDTTSVNARSAAFYRKIEPQDWGLLQPAAPDWLSRQDSFGDAVAVLNDADIPASAWVVLTHNSYVGERTPQVVVENCFGEKYPWALCPAHAEVREFSAQLAAGSVRNAQLTGVILEACGQMGAVHQNQHEKTDGVWSPAVVDLLSVCCCPSCETGWTHSPEGVRQTLRREVKRLLSADIREGSSRVSQELLAELLTNRQSTTDALRNQVLEQVPHDLRVTLHASLDPWATGALPGLTPEAVEQIDSVVVQCWNPTDSTLAMVERTRTHLPSSVSLGVYITAAAAQPIPEVHSYVSQLAEEGADELHLYHLGLAGPARWPDMVTAARTGAAKR